MDNWLGKSYKDEEVVNGFAVDSDDDGFTDALEVDLGFDPQNTNSHPERGVTNLASRLAKVDADADGLSVEKEKELGTDPQSSDSDQDGYSDGAEVLSETNPLNANSKPVDSDGDGLSTHYEANNSLNPQHPDTDFDGLRDDLELALGCDPHANDTDNDGILDGKEVELGNDPIIPEFK